MIFQEIRISIPFLSNHITMHRRMLGSAFDIGTFDISQMLIHQCVSLFRSRPLLPMVNLNTIERIYPCRSEALLDRVERKIRPTLMQRIKAWQTIIPNYWVLVTHVFLLPGLF
jgi:hypothetical protein